VADHAVDIDGVAEIELIVGHAKPNMTFGAGLLIGARTDTEVVDDVLLANSGQPPSLNIAGALPVPVRGSHYFFVALGVAVDT